MTVDVHMEDEMATMTFGAPAVQENETNLSKKAMLARLQVKKWSGSKYDRKVSAEVAANHNATAGAGRYRKNLLGKEKNPLKEVSAACDEARAVHYANTLPWGQDGSRILPKENYFTYVDEMRKLRGKFDKAVRGFLAVYPRLRDQAQSCLGTMWDAREYPTVAQLELKFSFDIAFLPFPDEKDFRVDLGEDEVEEIRASIAKSNSGAVELAMRDAYTRLHEGVSRMAERLGTPDGIFRDTLVSNLVELCDVLPKLNVTDDPRLTQMCNEVRAKLTAHSPETLRENKDAREKTAMDAAGILKMMGNFGVAA